MVGRVGRLRLLATAALDRWLSSRPAYAVGIQNSAYRPLLSTINHMKRSELTFSALLVPIDYLMIVFAGLTAYYLRFSSSLTEIREVYYTLPLHEYINIVIGVAALWVVVFAISGLYVIRGSRRPLDELAKIFIACSTGVMLIIILIFFQRELFSSRFIILAGWVISIVYVSLGRISVRALQRVLYRRGIGLHGVAVIGRDKTSHDLATALRLQPALGYAVVARAEAFDETTRATLLTAVQQGTLNEIILADTELDKESISRLVDFCDDQHLVFKYAADLFDTQASNLEIDAMFGVPMVEIKRTPLDGWGRIMKRVFDILGAVFFLVLFSPLMLITAVAIRLDTRGPVFVKLDRIGYRGRPFKILKFRSMVLNAHAQKKDLLQYNERGDGPLFKMERDPRITRVGRFIRRTSIDELPQFFNVLFGSMSLVGPRPHEPEEVAQYQKHHRRLLSIKPGVTGMAQISGRSDLTFEDEVRLDTFYIEHWTLKLDVRILLKTPWAVISPRKAA